MFVSEAVLRICGNSRYAYRRAKEAANQVGRQERALSKKKIEKFKLIASRCLFQTW